MKKTFKDQFGDSITIEGSPEEIFEYEEKWRLLHVKNVQEMQKAQDEYQKKKLLKG